MEAQHKQGYHSVCHTCLRTGTRKNKVRGYLNFSTEISWKSTSTKKVKWRRPSACYTNIYSQMSKQLKLESTPDSTCTLEGKCRGKNWFSKNKRGLTYFLGWQLRCTSSRFLKRQLVLVCLVGASPLWTRDNPASGLIARGHQHCGVTCDQRRGTSRKLIVLSRVI